MSTWSAEDQPTTSTERPAPSAPEYSPSPYGPLIYILPQPSTMVQPNRQQSTRTSDTFFCYEAKAAVKVLAAIMMLLHSLGAIGSYYVLAPGSTFYTEANRSLLVYSVLTLVSQLDMVNACLVQGSYWYFASAVWAISVFTDLLLIVFFAISVLALLADIVLRVTYIAALERASMVEIRIFVKSQYAPLPQYASPMLPQHAHQSLA